MYQDFKLYIFSKQVQAHTHQHHRTNIVQATAFFMTFSLKSEYTYFFTYFYLSTVTPFTNMD